MTIPTHWIRGDSGVIHNPAAGIVTPSSGVLRYATANQYDVSTLAAGATVAPFDFTGGGSYVDDPDGVFSAHPNVMTIPASWVAETGACIVVVSYGIMVNLNNTPGSPSAGAVCARLWVFNGWGVSSGQSIVSQDVRGYRELIDTEAAVFDTSLSDSVQIDSVGGGNVIELDLHNGLTGSGLSINQAMLSPGFWTATYFGIVKVGNG